MSGGFHTQFVLRDSIRRTLTRRPRSNQGSWEVHTTSHPDIRSRSCWHRQGRGPGRRCLGSACGPIGLPMTLQYPARWRRGSRSRQRRVCHRRHATCWRYRASHRHRRRSLGRRQEWMGPRPGWMARSKTGGSGDGFGGRGLCGGRFTSVAVGGDDGVGLGAVPVSVATAPLAGFQGTLGGSRGGENSGGSKGQNGHGLQGVHDGGIYSSRVSFEIAGGKECSFRDACLGNE